MKDPNATSRGAAILRAGTASSLCLVSALFPLSIACGDPELHQAAEQGGERATSAGRTSTTDSVALDAAVRAPASHSNAGGAHASAIGASGAAAPDSGEVEASSAGTGETAIGGSQAEQPTMPAHTDPGAEPPIGPSAYFGMHPEAGTPSPIGNTRIFDDIAGLTWSSTAQELLFVQSQDNQIMRWRDGLSDEMNFEVVRAGGEHMDEMKGLDLGPDGALWVCEARYSLPHRVSRSIDGYDHPVTVVDHWQGSAALAGSDFTSPWYISVRWDGNVYFTDTPHRYSGVPDKSLFRIDPQGNLSLLENYASDADLSEGGAFGIALSPNQRAFYISTWNHPGYPQLVRFDLDTDGSVADETLLMTDEDGPIQSVDGLCIDQAENLYLCTGGGGVRIYGPAGELLGMIDVPGATDCTFGGTDGKTLFVATSGGVAGDKNLYQVPMNIPGLP